MCIFNSSGHSRTVIGIEEHGQEIFLILLDPSHDSQQLHSVLMDTRNSIKLLLKSIQQFKQDEYEIIFIEGVLNEQEKKVDVVKSLIPRLYIV